MKPTDVRPRLIKELAGAISEILRNVPANSERQFEATPSTYDLAVFSKPGEVLAVQSGRFLRSGQEQRYVLPEQGPKMFLRLVPTIPTEPLSLQQALAIASESRLQPFALHSISGGEWCLRNKYGAIAFRARRDTDLIDDLTQLFKKRELWAITYLAKRFQDRRVVPSEFERGFVRAFENYIKLAREKLELALPLRLIAGITGIENYRMHIPIQYRNRLR